MKKYIMSFAMCIAICFLFSKAKSQELDSGYLDLGRVKLRKDFAQTISIKPEYLQQIPSSNLTDAISAWLYGNFSNTSTVMYVVDGNIVPDVNVYSIYDIAEITLVQSAMVQISGATGQAQLVVIKTKINRLGKFGATVAGQLFLVNNNLRSQANNSHLGSENNFYHQYNLSAYQNKEKIQYGVSANYLRDVLPSAKADSIHTSVPYNLSRFRLNAYLNAELGKNNELFINVNYTPQVLKFNQQLTIPDYAGNKFINEEQIHQPEKLFTPSIRLHSSLSKWSNDFSAGYYLYNAKEDLNRASLSNTDSDFLYTSSLSKSNVLYLGDRIGYNANFGSWKIEPSIDFRFSHIKESMNQSQIEYYNGSLASSSGYSSGAKGNIYLLTPSVSIIYKNIFNIQGGFLQNLSSSVPPSVKRTFPFVSASIDILKLSGSHNNALKLFGSYAKSGNFVDPDFTLSDFSSPVSNNSFGSGSPVISTGGLYYFPYQINYSTWIAEGGASWNSMHGRLNISYNFERRAFNAPVVIYYGYGGGVSAETIYPLVASSSHRLSLNVKIVETDKVDWFSGVNVTNLNINKGTINYFVAEYATGDYNTSKPSSTGGWFNRVRYKTYSFGVDMLYHFSQQILTTYNYYGSVVPPRTNSLILQNVYIGYQYKTSEFYVAARNLFQNSGGDLTNGNRYFGVGFKSILF